MFSLKDAVRKTILAVSLAAVTTSFFTGCNNDQPITSSDLYPPTITAEAPPSLTDDIDPGDPTTPDANTFSIKFKYWYDNPDVQEAQEKIPNPGGDDNGETFLDLAGLPIYTDPDGNEYIISGRTPVYLHNGKISSTESLLLRDESGNKVYAIEKGAEAVEGKIITPEGQAQTIEERQQYNTLPDASSDMPIYINNLKTELTTRDGKISLAEIFYACPGIGTTNPTKMGTDSQFIVNLHTAAGLVDVTFTYDEDSAKVTYSTGLKGTEIKVDEDFALGDATILLTPEMIECLLGYDVEPYDEFINIVTDNHDLFSSSNIVDEYDLNKATYYGEPPAEDTTPSEPETKPATHKSSNGKYDMTDADIENPDGTFTQDPETNPGAPEYIADRVANGLGQYPVEGSNPSKIPYSQITIENANEAFPYLGFTGEYPDYIMIRPGDSKSEIENKIYCNYMGYTAKEYFNNGTDQLDQIEAPEHLYKTEAEWEKALADFKAEQQRQLEADEQYEKDKNDPNYRIGDELHNLSTEELDELLWG